MNNSRRIYIAVCCYRLPGWGFYREVRALFCCRLIASKADTSDNYWSSMKYDCVAAFDISSIIDIEMVTAAGCLIELGGIVPVLNHNA